MTTVLFWDIDGTLLNTKGGGRLAVQEAASEMIGAPCELSSVNMAGMTDWGIATAVLEHIGIPVTLENIHQLQQRYQRYLPQSLAQTQGYVLEGVLSILHALQPRDDVLSLLLTGNMERGAWTKLSHYNLDYFFCGGGFCQSTSNRTDIARKALSIAQEQIGDVSLNKCYVIGDTPHDIRCGQAIGAKTIALANHRYSREELTQYNSWSVWDSYPSPANFLEEIGIN